MNMDLLTFYVLWHADIIDLYESWRLHWNCACLSPSSSKCSITFVPIISEFICQLSLFLPYWRLFRCETTFAAAPSNLVSNFWAFLFFCFSNAKSSVKLNHLFPLHPFSTDWKHQKIDVFPFSNVFPFSRRFPLHRWNPSFS